MMMSAADFCGPSGAWGKVLLAVTAGRYGVHSVPLSSGGQLLTLRLTSEESDLVWQVVDHACAASDVPLRDQLRKHAQYLPQRIRDQVEQFVCSREGALLISGLPVVAAEAGPTPAHWADVAPVLTRHDLVVALVSALAGELFGWPAEQRGRLVQDVVPIVDHENVQVNSGSATKIWWHTEDAFQWEPPDYIALYCIRNIERAETTLSTLADVELGIEVTAFLMSVDYGFYPDLSHVAEVPASRHFPILSGAPQDPLVRVDPYFMTIPEVDGAAAALEIFTAKVTEGLRSISLRSGECLVVDNRRAVHGRGSFKAAYGPQARWIKRTHIRKLR